MILMYAKVLEALYNDAILFKLQCVKSPRDLAKMWTLIQWTAGGAQGSVFPINCHWVVLVVMLSGCEVEPEFWLLVAGVTKKKHVILTGVTLAKLFNFSGPLFSPQKGLD